MIRTYLDCVTGLPWGTQSGDDLDLVNAPKESSMRITSTSRTSRNAFSNTSPCAN